MRHATAFAVILAAATPPADLAAQVPSLDHVDSLIAAADYDAARAAAEAWWAASRTQQTTGAQQARGLMLRAQLAQDPAEAESHYLAVVLGYPIAPEAPTALLRLGQGLLITGEPARAIGYLRRLVADYPGHPQRPNGLLWLARAATAARESAIACAAAREGVRDTRDSDLAAMFRIEEAAACAIAAETPATAAPAARTPAAQTPAAQTPAAQTPAAQTPAAQTPAAQTPAAQTPAAPAAPAAPRAQPTPAAGRFSAQTGAYRQQQSVDDMVARLRRAGYEPRVVTMPGSSLIRVRVGRFSAAGEAARLVTALKEARFDAVVVGDADQERDP